MAEYTPVTGAGTQLFYGSVSGTVTTELTNISNIKPAFDKYGTVDTVHLGSTRHGFIATLPEGGEFTFEYQWNAAIFNTVAGFKGVNKWYKIGFPDTTGDILFQGLMTQNDPDFSDPDTIPMVSVSMKINSAQTITVGS